MLRVVNEDQQQYLHRSPDSPGRQLDSSFRRASYRPFGRPPSVTLSCSTLLAKLTLEDIVCPWSLAKTTAPRSMGVLLQTPHVPLFFHFHGNNGRWTESEEREKEREREYLRRRNGTTKIMTDPQNNKAPAVQKKKQYNTHIDDHYLFY